jgi:colanic acid/amylovoran biosynthesis glycosyltransferase
MNSPHPCAVMQDLIQHGIHCQRIEMAHFTEQKVLQVLQKLKESPPDIFVPHLAVPAYFAARWVQAAGIPSIGVIHTSDHFHLDLLEEFVWKD